LAGRPLLVDGEFRDLKTVATGPTLWEAKQHGKRQSLVQLRLDKKRRGMTNSKKEVGLSWKKRHAPSAGKRNKKLGVIH